MPEKPDTEQLRAEQLAREHEERKSAGAAPAAEETAQHERRADKARYLRNKLEERAESERKASDSESGAADPPA